MGALAALTPKNTSLTLYRCYWPRVHAFLKQTNATRCVSDAYGPFMTIYVGVQEARHICHDLPHGAVVEIEQQTPHTNQQLEWQVVLFGAERDVAAEALKN